ncbi:MAG: DUF4397 domain-containing protein [Bacteroidetes bacterium]|nr:DUF4397 domain-containing protein [Bacteroidota bacterium]
MKLSNLKIKQLFSSIAGIAAVIAIPLVMDSCKKPVITSETFDASNLRVVNSLRDRTSVKFYLDTFNLSLTGTQNFNTNSVYWVVKSGLRKAKFFSTATSDTFATKDIQLDPDKDYTLYLTGDAANPKSWLTEDELESSVPDKAKIRLANLSSTLTNIDVTIQWVDPTDLNFPVQPEIKVFSNISPESVSSYASVAVATYKGNSLRRLHNIKVYEAGTSNLLLKLDQYDMRATSVNTFIISGLQGGPSSTSLRMRAVREWLDW